jgi:hypothetical protein
MLQGQQRGSSSHASTSISTVSSGGKNPRASRAGHLFETGQSVFEKALAPLTDQLAPGIQTRSDLVVAQAGGSHEDHLGSDDLEAWQRIFVPLLIFARIIAAPKAR